MKDESAQVDCVMFRGRAHLMPFRLQDGMRVEAHALVTLYEARGGFQLNVEALRHAGIGALFEAFARLRTKLETEGLFAPERRQPLPRFPHRIGIVTSLQAAALRDVLAALARRAPHIPVMIYPTLVQGDGPPRTSQKPSGPRQTAANAMSSSSPAAAAASRTCGRSMRRSSPEPSMPVPFRSSRGSATKPTPPSPTWRPTAAPPRPPLLPSWRAQAILKRKASCSTLPLPCARRCGNACRSACSASTCWRAD